MCYYGAAPGTAPGQRSCPTAQRPLLKSQHGPLCMEFSCSTCVCAGSLQAPWIPPTGQKHAAQVNWFTAKSPKISCQEKYVTVDFSLPHHFCSFLYLRMFISNCICCSSLLIKEQYWEVTDNAVSCAGRQQKPANFY